MEQALMQSGVTAPPMIAVLCENRAQFELYAREHPETVGRRIGRHRYDRAFCVTSIWDVEGRTVVEVIRYGTWFNLARLRDIEKALILAQIGARK